jgi:hypothetical protein
MEKQIRCVQITGQRVRYFPERIANNEGLLKKFGFIRQPIEEIEVVPQKPFPTPSVIVKPDATVKAEEKVLKASADKATAAKPAKPATKPTPKTKSK